MKYSNLITWLATIILLSITGSAYSEAGKFYAGVKYGAYSMDLGQWSVDDSDGYGLLLGYEVVDNISVEFDYGDSGKANFTGNDEYINGGELRVQNMALYGVFRTAGNVYAKVKGGVTYNYVDASSLRCSGSLCLNNIDSDDSGLAFGIGGGVSFAERFRAELEYSLIDQDIDIINLGLLVSF